MMAQQIRDIVEKTIRLLKDGNQFFQPDRRSAVVGEQLPERMVHQ